MHFPKLIGILIFFLLGKPLTAQVLINEYSAANRASFADNFGAFEDWIELKNTGSTAINLSGYHLSDNANNPNKWTIPAGIVIPANGYTIFFASGRNLVSGTSYHTSFKLTQSNFSEEVVFASPTGAILDSFSIRPMQVGHSRGRLLTGGRGVFTSPTPGASNGTGYIDYVEKPVFSIDAGFYSGTQILNLQSPSPTATIRYTTDGSEPQSTSLAYTAPLTITTTTMVRARCFSNSVNYLTGFIETNTYFINVNHSLPVVSVGSENYQNLFSNAMPEIVSSMEFFDVNHLLRFESYGEVDPHGNDSWAYPQKGIDFVVQDQYGYDEEIDYRIFHTQTRQKFERVMLKAAASDNYPFGPPVSCHLRDMFIQTLAQKARLNVDLRSAENCILYINGQYWGLYELREKVNDPDFTDYYHNQEEQDLDFLSYWGSLILRYGSDADWIDLYNYIMNNSMTVAANYQNVSNRLNLSSVIDYMILNTFSVNSDWINWNTMWWRGHGSPNVKWRYALWDMDNTFNLGQNFSGWPTTGYQANPCDLQSNFTNAGPNMGHLDIFRRLMENESFKTQFINRWSYLLNTYLNCTFVNHHLDSIVNVLTPEMPQQINRWGGSLSGWQSNLTFLRDQINGRCTVINQGIVDCYSVSGRHKFVCNTDPPGSGFITFNNQTFTSYPSTAYYFGGVSGSLNASAAAGYTFSHWETIHHTLLPNSLTPSTTFLIDTIDSIVAHFQPIVTHNITYLVSPPGSGSISVNGVTFPSTPLTLNYSNGLPVVLSAYPQTDFLFDHISTAHHLLTPSDTVPDVSFIASHNDTIYIYFRPVFRPSLAIFTSPTGGCGVKLNGYELTVSPFTDDFRKDTLIQLDYSNLDEKYYFGFWTSLHHLLLPDTAQPSVSFLISQSDTVVLHCIKKEEYLPAVYVPNTFSPNSDGTNDSFGVFCSQTVSGGSISIYDRWGLPVYSSSELCTALWDGTCGGKGLPLGIYSYSIEYIEVGGASHFLSGFINLIR